MTELRVADQRYSAILAVIGERRTITEVASEWRGSRQQCTPVWPAVAHARLGVAIQVVSPRWPQLGGAHRVHYAGVAPWLTEEAAERIERLLSRPV